MKTLIFSLVLMLIGSMVQAQDITELKETRVGFAPFSSDMTRNGDDFTFKVRENYVGEFEKDPLLFLDSHLDMKKFIAIVDKKDLQSYNVTLTSSRGNLDADFNKKGELIKSTSRFKNILLPEELRHQLYRDHKGWAMVKNVHITRGSRGEIEKEIYRIKLENGKQRKKVTFEAPAKDTEVAGL